MKSYSQTDIQEFREIHYKIQRKLRINLMVRQKARQFFQQELEKQQEAEEQILQKNAVYQIRCGDLKFKELIFWDSKIEQLLQSTDRLTYDFFLKLSYLQEQECLSQLSRERLVSFLLGQQILELKNDTFVFKVFELLIILRHKFIEEMFIIEIVLRLINHKSTYQMLSQILNDNDLIFNVMTLEIRFFINQIFEYANQKQQQKIVQVILKQRPQLVDQDRSLFELPLNLNEQKGNQEQN